MRRGGCFALAVLMVVAAAPVGSQASIVEVRDGALSVVQATGEATTTRILPVPGTAGAWQVSGARYAFGLRTPTPPYERWLGSSPAPGAGCGALGTPTSTVLGRAPYLRCDGVARVVLSFGDGPDYAETLGGPVALAGGGGRDSLVACQTSGAVLDGGPGDDDLQIFDGSAKGGAGDDHLFVTSCFVRGESPAQSRTMIDCGPGDDVLFYDYGRPRGQVHARTCPPVSRALRLLGPGTPSGDRVRIPADYQLRVPLFRASEPVTGTARLVHASVAGRRGGERCSSAARFRARANKPASVTVTISRSLVRKGLKRGFRFLACGVRFSATDGDGERFGNASVPPMRGYLLELNGAG